VQNRLPAKHPLRTVRALLDDALYDAEQTQHVAGIERLGDAVRGEYTILRFRHLLQCYWLPEQVFALLQGLREEKRPLFTSRTGEVRRSSPRLTLLTARQSRAILKCAIRTRSKDEHVGTMAHVDTRLNGLVHMLLTTDAAQSEFKQLPRLSPCADRNGR
jgi:hypothetical protein